MDTHVAIRLSPTYPSATAPPAHAMLDLSTSAFAGLMLRLDSLELLTGCHETLRA